MSTTGTLCLIFVSVAAAKCHSCEYLSMKHLQALSSIFRDVFVPHILYDDNTTVVAEIYI